jgi:hypothetical protein
MSVRRARAVPAFGLFDRHESELIDNALLAVYAKAPADAEFLRGTMERLGDVHALVNSSRQLRRPTRLGGEQRDESTLIDHLCSLDGLSGDLVLPLKATLSRTYLLSKINFLRAFVKAMVALTDEGPDYPRLTHDLREELAQSIYTLLAEELFLALLRKPDVPNLAKRRAADQLITVWDNAQLEIDDFAPMLESAWHARNRITNDFGTLLGTTEYVRLVCENCSTQVLEFFSRENVTPAEEDAFEEFLFNMTYEELTTLRRTMREQGRESVDVQWASRVLGRQIEELERSREIDPMALYRSYNRRQLAADFRLMAGAEGPKRTAEGYLMLYLLDQQAGD